MRVTPLARRLGSAALVLTLGVGLSACGGGDSEPADTSSSATDDSTDAGSSEGGTETPAAASLEELSATEFYPAVMAAMREVETFAFSTTTGGDGPESTMSGQARFSDKGVEMKASSTGAQAMEIIMVDKVMYMKAPDLGTGDKYLKIDLGDPNSLFGMLGKVADPEVMFKAMQTPKKIELIGEEEVDAVATNHYRITVDPTDYLKAMDFPAAMAEFMPEEMVTEMWVDGDNLPRKFAQTVETPSPTGGEATSSTSEGFYTDYGIDVDIEAPPADEVSENTMPGMG